VACSPVDVPSLYDELQTTQQQQGNLVKSWISSDKINLGTVKLLPLYLVLASILFGCSVVVLSLLLEYVDSIVGRFDL